MDAQDFVLIVGFGCVFFFGIIGNSMVCFVFHRKKRNRDIYEPEGQERHNFERLIFYLAIVDLISSIINPSVFTYWQATHYEAWHFGKFLCKVIPSLNAISINISIGFILLITVGRCRSICSPFKTPFTSKQTRLFSVTVCLLSVLLETPYAIQTDLMPLSTAKYLCPMTSYTPFQRTSSHHSLTDATHNSLELKNASPIKIFYFKVYKTCNDVYKNNISVDAARTNPYYIESYKSKALNHDSTNISKNCRLHCSHYSVTCYADKNLTYTKIEFSLTIVRDFTFIVALFISNYLVYLELSRKTSKVPLYTIQEQKKILTLLISMAFVFTLLVFPKDIFYLIYTGCYIYGWNMPLGVATTINSYLKLLQVFNSVCNPFIYAKLHTTFKRKVKSYRHTLELKVMSKRKYNDALLQKCDELPVANKNMVNRL